MNAGRNTYTAHLMFWDTDQTGEHLSVTPLEAVQPPETILDKESYQEAAELSQRFGVSPHSGILIRNWKRLPPKNAHIPNPEGLGMLCFSGILRGSAAAW